MFFRNHWLASVIEKEKTFEVKNKEGRDRSDAGKRRLFPASDRNCATAYFVPVSAVPFTYSV